MFGSTPNSYGSSNSRWAHFRSMISVFIENMEHPRLVLGTIAAVVIIVFGGLIAVSTKSSHKSKAQLVAPAISGSDPTSTGAVDYGQQLYGASDTSSGGDDGVYDTSADVYTNDSSDSSYGASDVYDNGSSSDTNDSDSVDQSYDQVNDVSYDPSTDAPVTTTPAQQGSVPGGTSAKVQKLLIFVEENHSYSQMLTGMPYTLSLAKKYGYASNYYGIRHPSLPNYVAIAGGNTYGISNDNGPGKNPVTATSIFGQAVSAGKSARVYADGMTNNCATSDGGNQYRVKHNPWAYFVKERSQCQKYDVPISALSSAAAKGSLPNVAMVVPNMCHDAHDCSLNLADDWFKSQMTAIFKGPDWKAGRLAIVLTADEDDSKAGNKVLTVVIHPSQKGHVVSTHLTHYSLSRLASQVTHTSPLRDASGAPNMAGAFNLPL